MKKLIFEELVIDIIREPVELSMSITGLSDSSASTVQFIDNPGINVSPPTQRVDTAYRGIDLPVQPEKYFNNEIKLWKLLHHSEQ